MLFTRGREHQRARRPGQPYLNDEAAYKAVRWARENDVPFLGTCGRLQYAVVEYFRNVLGVSDASHAESDGVDGSNVIRQLACSLQGQERLRGGGARHHEPP